MVKQSEAIQGTEKEFLNEFHKTLLFTKLLAGLGGFDDSYSVLNK